VLFFIPTLWRGYGINIFAQNRNIDSLLILIKKDKLDTNKVNDLNNLSREYVKIGASDSGLKYANQTLFLAKTIFKDDNKGWPKGIADGYSSIGNVYYKLGRYPEALKNFLASLEIRETNGDKRGVASSYGDIGKIYYKQGNYIEALKNHRISLKIREEVKDKLGTALAYNNIGNIYFTQANYPEALVNYFASLKIEQEIDDKQGIADSYNNIGATYGITGNYTAALKNNIASLKVREEMGNKHDIADSYGNIGSIYINQKNYTEALKNQFLSLKIREEIKDKHGIADSYNNIGFVYTQIHDYSNAIKNHLASLRIAEEIGDQNGVTRSFYNLAQAQVGLNKLKEAKFNISKSLVISKKAEDKEYIAGNYSLLSTIDSAEGNWKEAYLYHKLFMVYRDSINNEDTKKKIIQNTMRFQFQQEVSEAKAIQDKKDTVAAAEKKKQQLILILVVGVLILVFAFAGFIFRSLRITSKQKNIIELKNSEIILQKEIVEKQKYLVEEKQEEVIASITYAKRIQTALLTSDKYISKHLPAEHFILFKPKDIVSGDFYWALSIEPSLDWDRTANTIESLSSVQYKKIFYLITADCTGHGVPGAFMSMLNISYLNEIIGDRNIRLPHDILNAQRKRIIQSLNPLESTEESKDGMDCTLCVYDFDKMLLHFSAANNPLWLVRNEELVEYKADKMPVGKYSEAMKPFTLQTISLQKGDIIYTSTDGYADQFGTNGKKLMKKKFKEELIKICHLPMNEQKEYLNNFFENWKGTNEQVDDVCVIGVRI